MRGLFVRLQFDRRCECDGRSEGLIWLDVGMSVDVLASRSMAIVWDSGYP